MGAVTVREGGWLADSYIQEVDVSGEIFGKELRRGAVVYLIKIQFLLLPLLGVGLYHLL